MSKRLSHNPDFTSTPSNSNPNRILPSNNSASTRTPNSTGATVSTNSLSSTTRVSQANRQPSSSSERSNEVPPSIQPSSSSNSTSADLTASTLPVSNALSVALEPTGSGILDSLDQSDSPASPNQSPTRDLNIIKNSIDYSLFNRIKKRPISGVLNSDADAELTW